MPSKLNDEHYRNMSRDERMNIPRWRSAALGQFNEENRTVEMSFASETPCLDWWGDKEILRCNDEAMNTERFAAGVMPILFNHKRDAVVGKPTRIWTESGRAYAEIQFAQTEEAEKIMGLVKDGFIRGVSVGYRVNEWTLIEKGHKSEDGIEGPAWIATRWEVFEASIVTVPADASVGVGRSLPFPDDFENNIVPERSSGELKGGEKMSTDEKGKPTEEKRDANPTGVASAASPVNEDEIRAAAQRKERQRCTDINTLCDKFDIESEQRSKWINDGTNVETVNRELLEVLSTRNAARVSVKPEMGAAEEDKLRAAYRDGLALRAGIAIAKPADGAEKMRGMSQRDIARDILMRAGEKDVLQLNADELFVRAMSSSTYSDLLNATVKLSMSQGYAEVDTTFEAWTVEGTLSDFKTAYRYKLGGAQEPELIPENGEFTHAKLDKEKTAVQLGTDGIAWNYTRKLFINDDLDILAKFPYRIAAAFKRKINRLAYTALAGITYSSANGNLAAKAGVPSTETLSAARQLLRKQKDFSKKYSLNLNAKYLIIPSTYETTAEQLLRSLADPAGAHSGVANVFRNSLDIVVDTALDDINANAWYIAAAKNQVEGIEISYLNGNKTPILESKDSFDTLARSFRMYLDFGIAALDYRGFVKNTGK